MISPKAFFLILFFVLSLSHCSTTKEQSIGQVQLNSSQASSRQQSVSDVHYNLTFNFRKELSTYNGISEINFNWKNSGTKLLRVDFAEGKILSFKVNDTTTEYIHDGEKILISADRFSSGQNKITINFEQTFSKDGAGLYRFVDPEDNRVYLYSNLEPYDANKVFPCFDQPDLKATYEMLVTAPKSWEVITYAYKDSIKSKSAGFSTWHFPKSEKFSTYIWSLHAGPYHSWKHKGQSAYPLRLFARQSLKQYVKPEFWFQITRQGFEFFETYFDIKYPYKKYDQIIVPDFNAGAMENVASVTFSENYVKRGEKSRSDKRNLADVILHELAHMWFGNLVTMKWWNDLWLNESFASYMSALAMSKNTRFKGEEAWRDFYSMKQWAYTEDAYVTTHPIEGHVESTKDAFSSFDGITYGKGSSALKQLSFYIGEKQFRDGVRDYFKKYAGKNTIRENFINSLNAKTKVDLNAWTKVWLQSSGLNTIQAQYTCSNNKRIENFRIFQTKPVMGDQVLRPQKISIALYYEHNQKAKVSKQVNAMISGAVTPVSQLNGLRCPAFIDPNHNDHGYASVLLDETSQLYFMNHYTRIDNAFLRQRTWTSMWDAVITAKLSLGKYAKLVQEAVSLEKDPMVLKLFLSTTYGHRPNSNSVYSYWPKQNSQDLNLLFVFAERLEREIWQALKTSAPSSEKQKTLFYAFHRSVLSPYGIDRLKLLLDKKVKFKGLNLDQDKRWDLLTALARAGDQEALNRLEIEKKADSSSRGYTNYLSAKSSFGEAQFLKTWRGKITAEKVTEKYANLKAYLRHAYPPIQESQRDSKSTQFFNELRKIKDSSPDNLLSAFSYLGPSGCLKESRKEYVDFLEYRDLSPALEKALKIKLQTGERCERIRNAF